MKLFSVEGNSQRLDGGAMFGNAPKALWSRWVEPDDENRIPLACRAMLVDDLDGRRVLFETGVGAFFEPALRQRYGVVESDHVLLGSLERLGWSDRDIDAVFLSHLHFDHAGGLLSGYRDDRASELLFPNAEYLVGTEAFARARDPHPRDRASFIPGLTGMLESSGRLRLIPDDSAELFGGLVRLHRSDGHTPGMLLPEIAEQVVYCADLIPGSPWVHLPITMGYDRYPERLIDEKKAFLEDMLARDVRLFFTHDHKFACARVERNEKGRYTAVDPLPALDGEEARR